MCIQTKCECVYKRKRKKKTKRKRKTKTKGFSHDDAEEIVVKGFVNKSIEGMPEKVQERMLDILEKAKLGF